MQRDRRLVALALVALAGCGASRPGRSASADTVLAVTRGPARAHVLLTGALDAVDAAELKVPRTDAWQL